MGCLGEPSIRRAYRAGCGYDRTLGGTRSPCIGPESPTIPARALRPSDGRHAYLRLAKPKEELAEKGPAADIDFVLAFDAGAAKEQLKSMKERSVLIVNSEEKFTNPLLSKKKIRALTVDATGIALSATARPFPAAPMAGALSKAFPKLSLKALRSAIDADFYDRVAENQAALEQGAKSAR